MNEKEACLIYNTNQINMNYLSEKPIIAPVVKSEADYKTVGYFYTCKDYIHEYIASRVHGKKVNNVCLDEYGLNNFPLDKLQIVFKFQSPVDVIYKKILAIKKLFNNYEQQYGVKKTLVKVISCHMNKNSKFLLFTFGEHYIKSPVLLHAFIAAIRTIYQADAIVKLNNVEEVMANLSQYTDKDILSWAFRDKIIEKLFKYHSEITDELELKDIYPETAYATSNKASTYHSGFGLVALSRHLIFSDKYANQLYKLINIKE